MIYNLDDFIKQKYLEKYDVSSVSNKNKSFKNYKKDKKLIAKKELKKFAENVSDKFIDKICLDRNNKIYFYGINDIIQISEIIGICVIRRISENKDKKRYVILLIAIYPNVRKCGYGTIFLNEMIDYLKKKKKMDLILHSLKESIYFYIKYGFKQLEKGNYNRFLMNYEGLGKEEEMHLFKISL